MPKQLACGTQQVASQPLHLMVRMVDERLEVPLQMRPAPLGPAELPVHLRPVAVHHAVEGIRQQILEYRGGPRGPQREERVGTGDERPQPRLEPSLLRRRFVDAQHRFGRQLCRQFVISRRESGRRLILQLDDPTRRTWLIQDLFQEQGNPSFTLFEASHEQGHQCDQPRSRLALGHTCRKLAAGACRATGARQSVQLILGHQGFDFGDFPDLVPQRLRIRASQRFATAAAGLGDEGNNVRTVFDGNQRPFVLGMARLTARLLTAHSLLRRRPAMRMLAAGRQRRIPRSFVEPCLEVRNPSLQPGDRFRHLQKDRLGLGRNAVPELRRHPVHAGDVAEIVKLGKSNFPADSPRRAKRLRCNV